MSPFFCDLNLLTADPGLPVCQGHRGGTHHACKQRWCHETRWPSAFVTGEADKDPVCHGGERHRRVTRIYILTCGALAWLYSLSATAS